MTEQPIIHQARLHWIIFLWPVVLWLLMIYFALTIHTFQIFPAMGAIIALIWGGVVWLTYHCSSLTIHKKHVILRTGILMRQTIDIPMKKIASMDIRQSILGCLLGYGALIITGTGGTRQCISYLKGPLTCRRYIEQLMHA